MKKKEKKRGKDLVKSSKTLREDLNLSTVLAAKVASGSVLNSGMVRGKIEFCLHAVLCDEMFYAWELFCFLLPLICVGPD